MPAKKWMRWSASRRADSILAPALAYRLGAGFVPVRKPKKLPWKATSVSYQLEYGTDTLEIHQDAITPVSGCSLAMICLPRAARLRLPLNSFANWAAKWPVRPLRWNSHF